MHAERALIYYCTTAIEGTLCADREVLHFIAWQFEEDYGCCFRLDYCCCIMKNIQKVTRPSLKRQGRSPIIGCRTHTDAEKHTDMGVDYVYETSVISE